MKKAMALFVLLFVMIALAPPDADARRSRDPQYLYILVGPDGRLMSETAPDVYWRLHSAFKFAGLINVKDENKTRKALDKAGMTSLSESRILSAIRAISKDQREKYIFAQMITGNWDEGDVKMWLIEDGKTQMEGESIRFSPTQKPTLGPVDTVMLGAMQAFETYGGDSDKLKEIEKFGDLDKITGAYRQTGGRGLVFSRQYQLESTRARMMMKYEASIELAKKAIGLDPYWPANYATLGEVLEEDEKQALFPDIVEDAIRQYAETPGMLLVLAESLDVENDQLKLQAVLEKIKKHFGDHYKVIDIEIKLHVRKKEYDVLPDMIRRYYLAGGITAKEKRTLSLDMGKTLWENEKYEKAIEVYEIILKHDKQASIYLEIAKCHDKLGNKLKRLDALLGAFEQLPDESMTWTIIDIARDTGTTSVALKRLGDLADRLPDDTTSRCAIGLLQTLDRDLPRALKSYKEARRIDPSDRYSAYYRLVSIGALGTAEEFDQAKGLFESNFGTADMMDVTANVVRLLGFEGGVRLLAPEANIGATDFEVFFDLSTCYLALDDWKSFKKLFKVMEEYEEAKNSAQWGLILAIWYGKKKRDSVLERVIETAEKAARERKGKSLKPNYRFSLFKHHVVKKLDHRQAKNAEIYLEFIFGKYTVGNLTHHLTNK